MRLEGAKRELIENGHDVIWTGDLSVDPGDDQILELARSEDRVLITLDTDSGELVFLRGLSHSGIVRLVEIPSRSQAKVVLEVLRIYGEQLTSGAFATVETDRIRIRLPLTR